MVKRKKAVTQNPSTASKSDMLSPKTPGWKSANAEMFAEPIPTPKSQMTTRRMTRRASMYQANKAVGKEKMADKLSPVSTRSRRSMYVKRLQSPKSKKSSSRVTRGRPLAIRESVDQLQQKPRIPKPSKSIKSVNSRVRSKQHPSDISVDVNIRMPGMPGMRRSSKSLKQTHSDPVLASSSSSVGLSDMSDISSIVNRTLDRRHALGDMSRRSQVQAHSPQGYSVSRRASSKSTEPWQNNDSPLTSAGSSATTVADDEENEITFKRSFTTKTPSRKQRKGNEVMQRNLSPLSSVTSTESLDISYSTPPPSPPVKRQQQQTPSASRSTKTGKSKSKLRKSASHDNLDRAERSPAPSRSTKMGKSKSKLRKSASHDNLDKAERSPAALRSTKTGKSKSKLRKSASHDDIDRVEQSPAASRSTKTGKSKSKLRKSVSRDDLNTGESYGTPAAKLQGWSPYNKQQQQQQYLQQVESSDTDVSLCDVSQQASFSTPSKSGKRPMRSEELASAKAAKVLGITARDTPRKAVKILGKTTPSSRPIKRIKTPGRRTRGMPPKRHREEEQEQEEDEESLGHNTSRVLRSCRKRRASSQFAELSPMKRARSSWRREQPEPSWWETWCTIL